jgi:hypothetical protein
VKTGRYAVSIENTEPKINIELLTNEWVYILEVLENENMLHYGLAEDGEETLSEKLITTIAAKLDKEFTTTTQVLKKMQIIIPEISNDSVSNDLRDLTQTLMQLGHATTGGLLGGENGYGVYFENEVFAMHPYCWCEGDDCKWCNPCLCPAEVDTYLVNKVEVDIETWAKTDKQNREIVHNKELECKRCSEKIESAPNFLHKPTNSKIWWYKYIGRGMEFGLHANWKDIMKEVKESIT